MKKAFSCVLFGFMLSFLFVFSNSKVSALDNFWNELGTEYTSIEVDTGAKYSFGERANYNYTFDYSYAIRTSNYITDNSAPISYFYGIKEATPVSYTNLSGGFGITIDDRFIVYKYNYATKDFAVEYNPGANKSGTYTIEQIGIYKLVTDGVDGSSKNTYIVYENAFNRVYLEENAFNKDDKTINLKLKIKDPRKLDDIDGCEFNSVRVLDSSGAKYSIETIEQGSSYTVSAIDVDLYEIEIILKVVGTSQGQLDVVKNGTLGIELEDNLITKTNNNSDIAIEYDLLSPVYVSGKYYNKDLYPFFAVDQIGEEPTITSNNVFELVVRDDTNIVSATVNDQVCEYEKEEQTYTILCSLEGENKPTALIYRVEDEYGNVYQLDHNVVYDDELLIENDSLENYLSLSNNTLINDFDSSSYVDINQVCIMYGNTMQGKYECSQTEVTATYYYSGTVVLAAFDDAGNYAFIELEDVTLTNGYLESDFTFDIEGNREATLIADKVSDLYRVVCADNDDCPGRKESVFVKYGDLIEPIERSEELLVDTEQLPSYLEILNKKFNDSTCYGKDCDKVVEVFIKYEISGVEQIVSMFFRYDDKLPKVSDYLLVSDVNLEYGKFDIKSSNVIQSLYGDELGVTLVDGLNNTYTGVITPIFVKYIDKESNVTLLDDKPYTYISNVSELGKYILECRVKMLSNITTGEVYSQDLFAKSFFITVTLEDTILPELTLNGDAEVKVKQYNAYKDAGAKCSDINGCNVKITYYFNEVKEGNEVEKIDTDKSGKYIIRYVAEDNSGNLSSVKERVVIVQAIDEFNATTVIIIISVVIFFGLLIALAVVVEVKKGKKRKNME